MRLGFDATAGRFVDLGFAATVLLALVALAMLCTRQPARRLRIARLGLLGVLSLPILDQFDFVPRVNLGPQAAEAVRFVFEWIAPGSESWWDRLPSRLRGGNVARAAFWMLASYLTIVALGLGRLALGWLGTRRLLADTTGPGPELAALYEAIPGPPVRPELRLSPRVTRPALVGIFRPTILVPTSLDAAESIAHARAVLSHELAHAESSDPLFGLLVEILQVVAFPVIPLWWIKRQTKLDQELVADAQAAGVVGGATSYAASLMEFAASEPTESAGSRIEASRQTLDGSDLYRRFLVLLQPRFPLESRPSIMWLLGCTAIVFAAILVSAMINARPNFGGSARVPGVPVSGTMSVSTITVAPLAAASIPLPAPDAVVLEGGLTCDDATLATLKLGGVPMHRAEPGTLDVPGPATPHRFECTVTGGTVRLFVDGRARGVAEHPARLDHLTIESRCDKPVVFSGMSIHWGIRPPN